ncbi:MAG: hypothetical protein WB799_18945 [Candidatus Sulfotelmatobacter sp.]
MNGLLHDLRYAMRQLRKNPWFACTAILILTLGMCVSVAIFGFVDAALIKPLPYPNPTRLVEVTESIALLPRANLSYPDYLELFGVRSWDASTFASVSMLLAISALLASYLPARKAAQTDPMVALRYE